MGTDGPTVAGTRPWTEVGRHAVCNTGSGGIPAYRAGFTPA